MNVRTHVLPFLCLAVAAAAQGNDDGGPLAGLSRSASQDLAKSVEELNGLRQQIEGERMPMATELTALEEKLALLRKEHDRIARLVDEGNLAIANIKTESKMRQDELDYVGLRLDEYARAFETRVNPCELQYCGETLEQAKAAIENQALSPAERFDRQLDLVQISLRRAADSIGGTTFPGVAVDLQGNVQNGKFALVGPIALFRGDDGGAGLVVPQAGSSRPLVRPLEGEPQAGLAALVQGGAGTAPVDPSRGGALKALIQRTNLLHIFEKGGPIMWPLLFASVLALGTVLERVLFLMWERKRRNPKSLEALFAAVGRGDIEGAVRGAEGSKFYVVRAIAYALAHREQSLPNALLYAQGREIKRFRRGVPILDTVITLAPLLGLLGTVTGMMGSFSLIGGDLGAPGAITGGIAEALIATAFGLGIAITALIPFNFLNSRLDDASHEIESAATQLELLVQPRAAVAPVRHDERDEVVVA
jgi:biopolymer transport protein ExbB